MPLFCWQEAYCGRGACWSNKISRTRTSQLLLLNNEERDFLVFSVSGGLQNTHRCAQLLACEIIAFRQTFVSFSLQKAAR